MATGTPRSRAARASASSNVAMATPCDFARLKAQQSGIGDVLWELPVDDGARVADTDEAIAVLVDGQLTLYSRT